MSDNPHIAATDGWPFTVLLLIPDFMRNDEACEADWVRRVWVHAMDHECAISAARDICIKTFEWGDLIPEGELDLLAPLAVYHGHMFDMLQP